MIKTEQMVRKIYCPKCIVISNTKTPCFNLCNEALEFPKLARRFLRLEQAEKDKKELDRMFHNPTEIKRKKRRKCK